MLQLLLMRSGVHMPALEKFSITLWKNMRRSVGGVSELNAQDHVNVICSGFSRVNDRLANIAEANVMQIIRASTYLCELDVLEGEIMFPSAESSCTYRRLNLKPLNFDIPWTRPRSFHPLCGRVLCTAQWLKIRTIHLACTKEHRRFSFFRTWAIYRRRALARNQL